MCCFFASPMSLWYIWSAVYFLNAFNAIGRHQISVNNIYLNNVKIQNRTSVVFLGESHYFHANTDKNSMNGGKSLFLNRDHLCRQSRLFICLIFFSEILRILSVSGFKELNFPQVVF